MDIHDCFDAYERRFARAMASLPERKPWTDTGRTEIIETVRRCLGVRDEWAPMVHAECDRTSPGAGFTVEHLQATSWPGVRATALLYLPDPTPREPMALIALCCGHGGGGKLYPAYQVMARHLVRRGATVLVPDNIGQGERVAMGHRDVVSPFASGLSLQGLIIMETLGWIAWAQREPRVDPQRLAAIGNSGGGHMTTYLSALCPQLAALSSSGRPCSSEFVARKEKQLCHCSVVPGIIGEIEAWHILSCFAPRPLFIFQGRCDSMFPVDLFHSTARKTRWTYEKLGAPDSFRADAVPGEHTWDADRCVLLGDYLSETLDLPGREPAAISPEEPLFDETAHCFRSWPDDALTVHELCFQLTGVKVDPGLKLWDVFRPDCPDGDPLAQVTERGQSRQILAQFEAFLKAEAT